MKEGEFVFVVLRQIKYEGETVLGIYRRSIDAARAVSSLREVNTLADVDYYHESWRLK